MRLSIKKGNHYSNVSFLHRLPIFDYTEYNEKTFLDKVSNFNRFDSNLRYGVFSKEISLINTDKTNTNGQVNKLWGICFGVNPHKNSFRFGWNHSDKELILYAYTYQNMVRNIKQLFSVKEYPYNIFTNNFRIYFAFNHSEIRVFPAIEGCVKASVFNYYSFPYSVFWFHLYPYFGGKLPAPKDLKFTLKCLEN